jgi:hypothetical protein
MIAWTCDRLDEKFTERFEEPVMRANRDTESGVLAPVLSVEKALDAAERGDMDPLLTLRPRLTKFVKRRYGRGKYRRKHKVEVHPTARWAARCIQREIWPEHFGRRSRRLTDPLSIRELVAAWLDVDQDEIHWKAPGKTKPPKGAR